MSRGPTDADVGNLREVGNAVISGEEAIHSSQALLNAAGGEEVLLTDAVQPVSTTDRGP